MDQLKFYPERKIDLDVGSYRALLWIETKSKVLELGCATGYISKVLKEKFECEVTGFELNPIMAKEAETYCDRVFVGDLEAFNFVNAFEEEYFDIILCIDVLEHLKFPDLVLRKLRDYLKPEGCVVASIPNIAHASVILEMLEGEFCYRELGLLDSTHIRFFTRKSIISMFEKEGFFITLLERVITDPRETEFKTEFSRYPQEILNFIQTNNLEWNSYQFIVKAEKCSEKNTQKRLISENEELKRVLEEYQLKIKERYINIKELEQIDNEKTQQVNQFQQKSLIIAKELAKYPLLIRLFTIGYRLLAKIYRIFTKNSYR